MLDKLIDRRPGLDHEHHLARRGQAADQFFQRMTADEVFALGASGQQVVDLADGAVVHGDLKSPALNIKGQVFAHHGQADQSEVAIVVHGMFWGSEDYFRYFIIRLVSTQNQTK